MYGKHFTSMYSGSLFGKPAIVFAVWGYAFSHMRQSRGDGLCYVELNPTLLAATFATTAEDVLSALDVLEAPDPSSRSSADEGRRLILMSDTRHTGPMQYRVVNGPHYRAMRDEEERRVYLREAKRRERAGKAVNKVNKVNNVNRRQPPSTQAEAEAEIHTGSSAAKRARGSRKKRSDDPVTAAAFEEDLALLRTVSTTARKGRCEALYVAAVSRQGLEAVRAAVGRGVENYGVRLRADRTKYDRRPKEDATLLSNILAGDFQEPTSTPITDPNLPASGRPLEVVL